MFELLSQKMIKISVDDVRPEAIDALIGR